MVTHSVGPRVLAGALILVAAAGVAGCGSKKQEADKPAVAEIDGTINDGAFETTETLDCADGKGLNIGGSKNTLTITGRCGSVIVGGDDNKITFDKVDTELIVAGLNNTITYREGDPQVQDLGTGNSINKG